MFRINVSLIYLNTGMLKRWLSDIILPCVLRSERGFVLVRTASSSPFALGRWRFKDADPPPLVLNEAVFFRRLLGSRAQELTLE